MLWFWLRPTRYTDRQITLRHIHRVPTPAKQLQPAWWTSILAIAVKPKLPAQNSFAWRRCDKSRRSQPVATHGRPPAPRATTPHGLARFIVMLRGERPARAEVVVTGVDELLDHGHLPGFCMLSCTTDDLRAEAPTGRHVATTDVDHLVVLHGLLLRFFWDQFRRQG